MYTLKYNLISLFESLSDPEILSRLRIIYQVFKMQQLFAMHSLFQNKTH